MVQPGFRYRRAGEHDPNVVHVDRETTRRPLEIDDFVQCRWCGRLTKDLNALGYCGRKCLIEDRGPQGDAELERAEALVAESNARTLKFAGIGLVVIVALLFVLSRVEFESDRKERQLAELALRAHAELGDQQVLVYEDDWGPTGEPRPAIAKRIKIRDYRWSVGMAPDGSRTVVYWGTLNKMHGNHPTVKIHDRTTEAKVLEFLESCPTRSGRGCDLCNSF